MPFSIERTFRVVITLLSLAQCIYIPGDIQCMDLSFSPLSPALDNMLTRWVADWPLPAYPLPTPVVSSGDPGAMLLGLLLDLTPDTVKLMNFHLIHLTNVTCPASGAYAC